MAVNAAVTLPNQPATGSVTLRPLGGNGYSSPMSAYLVRLFAVTADASGGVASLDLFMDPQFESVVSFVSLTAASAAASEQVRFDMYQRDAAAAGITRWEFPGTMSFNSDTGSTIAFSPPPLFDIGRLSMNTDNVDTEQYFLSTMVYNFKRDAAQKTPLAVLLASLPRGFNITGPFA